MHACHKADYTFRASRYHTDTDSWISKRFIRRVAFVTPLSLLRSSDRGEQKLPHPIRYQQKVSPSKSSPNKTTEDLWLSYRVSQVSYRAHLIEANVEKLYAHTHPISCHRHLWKLILEIERATISSWDLCLKRLFANSLHTYLPYFSTSI
jgi:hypothetical protein